MKLFRSMFLSFLILIFNFSLNYYKERLLDIGYKINFDELVEDESEDDDKHKVIL